MTGERTSTNEVPLKKMIVFGFPWFLSRYSSFTVDVISVSGRAIVPVYCPDTAYPPRGRGVLYRFSGNSDSESSDMEIYSYMYFELSPSAN